MALALYHNDMSSCAQKVRLVLAEKGLDWENRHLNLRAGEHQKDWYIKLNPRAVVPTLIDGDIVVPESNVINEYLDERFPDPPLKPPSRSAAPDAALDQAARRGRARRRHRGAELRAGVPPSVPDPRRSRESRCWKASPIRSSASAAAT